MNCAFIAPDRCLSNQFLKTQWRLHQCLRQPVQCFLILPIGKLLFIQMGAWARFLIYLSSHIKVERHVATLLVTCRVS